jgi:glycosyltransferase involved in cell wall biosynthesis
MHLLIISPTNHYRDGEKILGWGPYINEINWIARTFDRVTHIAVLQPGPPPASSISYQAKNIATILLPPAGGLTIKQKLLVLKNAPRYINSIVRQIPKADIIYVRTPGAMGLYGMVLVSILSRKPHWIKYAGNWAASGGDELTLLRHFVRDWLRLGLSHGPVTVNGSWANQPKYIFSFLNPSFSQSEIVTARKENRSKELSLPIRLVFIGRLEIPKGPHRAIQILHQLIIHKVNARLDIIGDGPMRSDLERDTHKLGLDEYITFHSWLPHDQVKLFLSNMHFILLPTVSEGWPKVLSEAMAYGCVPIASDVSSIPQILDQTGAGLYCQPDDIQAFTQAVVSLVKKPDDWKIHSLAGISAAPLFSYENYLLKLDEMFKNYYGSSPMKLDRIDVSTLKDK